MSTSSPEEMVGAPARYKIEGWLGAGGMADVFLCTMHGAGGFARPVAVKVVREAFANQPRLCEMFNEEARLASRLNHPNIVNVLDFNSDLRGRPFLVMEYMNGRDLSAVMEGGPLPVSTAIFVATEVLRGLGHAHAATQENGRRGLVHRDVSPQNILLSREGAVKVADFGIAKALSSSDQSSLKGKSSYMSPEQINGDPVDGRADLFAVGVVLWEMLTGKRLYGGGKPRESFARIVLGEVPLPSLAHPAVPADVERVTLKLLAKQPAQRHACAEEAIAELLQCADAPRNGPGELAALLALRCPESGQAAAPFSSSAPPGAAAAPTTRTASASFDTSNVKTLSMAPVHPRRPASARSRSVARAQRRGGRCEPR